MNIFIWNNPNTKESAALLANKLSAQYGAIPPRDFSGLLISWGARPSEKFRWQDRTIKAAINDPRINSRYANKEFLFSHLRAHGFDVRKGLGSTRYFIFRGQVIGAVSRAAANREDFINAAANECGEDPNVAKRVIRVLLENGIVSQKKEYLGRFVGVGGSGYQTQTQVPLAQNVAKALGLDFCAVDLVSRYSTTVSNVVLAPNLTEVPDIAERLAMGLSSWVQENSKTSKQKLQELASAADENIADSILEILRKEKLKGSAANG